MRNKIRYYLDTEFIELPERKAIRPKIKTMPSGEQETVILPATIILLSIGLVDDTGREYYAVNTEADCSEASQWVKENVLQKMPEYHKAYGDLRGYKFGKDYVHPEIGTKPQEKKTIQDIKRDLTHWTGQNNNVPEECEFWGYYADYDWVVFCWIFGSMMNLPKGYPMYCKDLKQIMDTYPILTKEWKEKTCPDPEGEHNALVDAKWNRILHKSILIELLLHPHVPAPFLPLHSHGAIATAAP